MPRKSAPRRKAAAPVVSDDLTARPEEWPDWVLSPQVRGGSRAEQHAAFLDWRARRTAWAFEHTSLWTEHHGRPVIAKFVTAASLEHRRRSGTPDPGRWAS